MWGEYQLTLARNLNLNIFVTRTVGEERGSGELDVGTMTSVLR